MPGGIRGPFQFQLTSLRSCRSVRSRCAFLRRPRGVALLRVSLAIAFRWAWIQANPVQSAIEYAPSRAPRRPRLAPGSPERPGGSCGSSWSAGRRPARLRWWSRWSSSSAQEGHAEVVQVLLEGHATVNQASRNDGNLRIGEAKPLGMATKQHLIHPNPDRHAPSLAAVHRSCSGCSARSSCVATRTTACRLADLLCANELGPRALGCTFQPPN